LTLELGRFLIQIGDNERHITEDVSVDNGSNSDRTRHKSHLKGASRQNIIARKQEHGVVECDEVLIG